MEDSKRVHIMKASRLLQAKAGRGEINPEKIEKSQAVIDNFEADFSSFAESEIKRLKTVLEKLKTDIKRNPDLPVDNALIVPVMQLKGQGKMFGYPLVSEMMAILLDFLERVDSLDNDSLDIVESVIDPLELIARNKLNSSGETRKAALIEELKDACRRYYQKHPDKVDGNDNEDAFWVE